MSTYNQMIFPAQAIGKTVIQFRINKSNTGDFIYPTAAQSVRLDPFKYLYQEGFEYNRSVSDEDGDMPSDDMDIRLQDTFTYTGVSNGVSVSHDFHSAKSSMLDDFFDDDTATYTAWFTQVKGKGTTGVANGTTTFTDVNGKFNSTRHLNMGLEIHGVGTYKITAVGSATSITLDGAPSTATGLAYTIHELFFCGDLDPKNIARKHQRTNKPHTADAQRYQSVSLKFSMAAQRLKAIPISALIALFSRSDMANSTRRSAFYGGIITSPNFWLPSNITDFSSYLGTPAFFGLKLQKASYGTGLGADDIWPKGFWAVSMSTLVSKVCEAADIQFANPLTDITNRINLYSQTYDAPGYATALLPNSFGAIYLNYNYLFGISPIDGSAMETPVSFNHEDGTNEVLKAIAFQFGMYVKFDYDQSTFLPNLKLVNRRSTSGTFPALKVKSSEEKERLIGKESVRVSYEGDDSYICVGRQDSEAADVKLRWRTKAWGNTTQVLRQHLIHDPKFYADQKDAERWFCTNAAMDKMNADGWLGGAYLYHQYVFTTNLYYPSTASWTSSDTPNTDWSGFYTCSHAEFDGGASPSSMADDPRHEMAKFYYHELVGNRAALDREYQGVTDLSGNITGLSPLMTRTEFVRGATRTFKVVSISQKFVSNTTKVTEVEVFSDASWKALHTTIGGTESGSTGGTGSSTGNRGETVGTGFLLRQPTETLENTATAQSATVTPLTLKAHASQSEELFDAQTSDGLTKVSIGPGGNLNILPTGTGSGATGELRFYELVANGAHYIAQKAPDVLAASLTFTWPAAIVTDGFLKTSATGVLSFETIPSATGFVLKSPDDDADNLITIQNATTKGLRIKAASSQSDNVFEAMTNTDVVTTWLDENCALRSTQNVYLDNVSNTLFASNVDIDRNLLITQGNSGLDAFEIRRHATAVNPAFTVRDSTGANKNFEIDDAGDVFIGELGAGTNSLHLNGRLTVESTALTLPNVGVNNAVSLSSKTVAFMTPAANRSVGGFAAPATDRLVLLQNTTAFTVTLNHSEPTEVAGNRILCPGGANYSIGQNEGCWLSYDGVTLRWYVCDK